MESNLEREIKELDVNEPVPRKRNYGVILFCAAAVTLASWLTCEIERKKSIRTIKPTQHWLERHDVDQVFRDHNGYRVYFTEAEGRVIEKKYFSDGEASRMNYSNIPFPEFKDLRFKGLQERTDHVKIYKDADGKGYAEVLHYKGDWSHNGNDHLYYVEIHLPQDAKLSPGNESYGGKFRTNTPLTEIK